MKILAMAIGMFLLILSIETSFAGETAQNSSQNSLFSEKDIANNSYINQFGSDKSTQKHPLVLKSNLLYWATATPNISVEFYLSSQLSLNTELDFAWWSNKNSLFYWQVFAVSPELRYWFSHNRPFKGHYVGVYASGGIYDIMFKTLTGDKGYQGEFCTAAGVSYGYVFPISKRLSLEVGLGIGYLTTKYHEYVWECSDFMRTYTKRTTWIGPTKINLMLVWQIPR